MKTVFSFRGSAAGKNALYAGKYAELREKQTL